MIQLLKVAIRDLNRNRRRSLLSALALGMGLGLLMLMAAVLTGEMRNAMDATIRLQSGHLQVTAATYDEDKTSLAWEDLVENPVQMAAQIAALTPVDVATPRLFASGMVADGEETTGVRIVGIDPASAANKPFQDGLTAGSYLAADDRDGILIGKTLAEQLDLQAGQAVNLLVNTSNGDVDEQVFTIRGIYTTGIPGYDQSTVFMPLSKAQAITQTDGHASTVFVLLKNKEDAPSVVSALQAGRYQVKTWEQMNEILIQTEQMSNAYIIILYLIVLAITATVIVNTLVMSVFERTREIGILSAIGMKSRSIMAMFFAESSLLALLGILMGLGIGSLLALYASKIGFYIGNMGVTGIMMGERIYGQLTLQDTVSLVITAFVVTLLASLYPALLAAHLEPVEALRSGQ